jgi:hypothetical protein
MFTAEQIEAIGGNRWTKAGKDRVYLNDNVWAPIIGLDIQRYKSGNIQYAELNGTKLSNARAARLLACKVYWEAGTIHITDGPLADEHYHRVVDGIRLLTAAAA